jgi:hypothetical protein
VAIKNLPEVSAKKVGESKQYISARPAAMAMRMAMPPSLGVGVGCERRPPGKSIAPIKKANRRITGVKTTQAAALSEKRIRYFAKLLPIERLGVGRKRCWFNAPNGTKRFSLMPRD